ncbi:MAG: hypothetical protein N5P05_000329 [Chroococcopsis gigantea SAG 12.99]|jgi:hypothetical protein|nr:hypothetical protein [Chroococcopsis gigantea SAG 12.99]
MTQKLNLSIFVAVIVMIAVGLINTIDTTRADALSPVYQLPDLSGLAWVKDDLFVAVHDAKNSKENGDRISLLTIPDRSRKLVWQPQSINWPSPLGRSSDLESITRVPETSLFLAAESGGDRKKGYTRIFKLKYDRDRLSLIESINWPVNINNVEAITIAKIKDKYLFLYAERNDGQPGTTIKWASMTLNPWGWTQFQGVEFRGPLEGKNVRPITDMAVDSRNNLYIATAFDPDRDDGPFYSAVYQIGTIELNGENGFQVNLYLQPNRIGGLDGLKVEGLTLQEKPGSQTKMFIGTDDEIYGGVLRQLPFI